MKFRLCLHRFRVGGGVVLRHCEQCGCSGGLGVGWVSFVRSDPDDPGDRSWIGAYCPRRLWVGSIRAR